MKNKGSLNLKPGSLMIRFCPLIHAEEIDSLEIEEIMELTRQRISDGLEPFEAGELTD